MNKTKFFSSLLVAVLFATTSVFVSCKDYDDDIKNLQSQVDKAALKADLDALSTKLAGAESAANAAKTTAESALTKANANATEIAAVKATAEKAAADAAKALTDVANAQSTAEAAQKAAEAAQKIADEAATKKELADAVKKVEDAAKALSDAAATKKELADAQEELKKYADAAKGLALADAKTYTDEAVKSLATNAAVEKLSKDLNAEITGLKTTLAAITGEEEMDKLVKIVGSFDTIVETLFSAVTSVELYASYSWNNSDEANSLHSQMYANAWEDQGNLYCYTGIRPLYLNFTHGTVSEDSKFGDNEAYTAADKQIEYKKGADIKDATELIIRVNPVNADITNANIKLINSLGEALDVVTVTKAERYNELITRGSSVNSGLWKLTLKAADGISEESFEKAVTDTTSVNNDPIAFAVAVNNTAENSEDRYVASTFDLVASYRTYMPSSAFTFSVNGTSVNSVRNRWGEWDNDDYRVVAEHQENITTNPELAWKVSTDKIPTPATAIVGKVGDNDTNVEIDINKYNTELRRYGYSFVYADVNEPFVLSKFIGRYNPKALDYYYVVFDKGNAIESAPSEWNAWNSYTVEGLGVMTPADKKLTMKITSASAKGDVVGFRVYAVNRDGTLADPDGRAFYVYVGKKGEENKEASAKIVATKTQPESEAMDVKGWFKDGITYYFAPNDVNTRNNNPKWFTSATQSGNFGMSNVILKFYDKNGDLLTNGTYTNPTSIAGADIKDAVKVTFTPNNNIAGMLNDSTYTIFISQNLEHAGDVTRSLYATLSVTKVMPDKAVTLEFRPKQETTEGSGDFIAYMIPNEEAWTTPWATAFTDISSADNMKKAYDATTARNNGFKDLNNVFYDLNKKDNIEFVFANSLKKDNKVVDLVDDNKQGIVYETPGEYYILDVAAEFIDGKTKHNVQTYTHYFGVSTYYDKDNNNQLVYGEDWTLKSDQKLTATYACWHHAIHDIAFKNAVNLQWSAAGEGGEALYSNITTKNSYNSTYFGLTLDKLIDNKWLKYVQGSAELNTKADGSGQKNPYFEPTMDDNAKKVLFTQNSVQVDANPTADHDEYLIIKFKDAFDHTVVVSSKLKIKKAVSNAPRH